MQRDFYVNGSSKTKPTSSGKCEDSVQTLKLQLWAEKDLPAWEFGMNFAQLDSGHFSLNFMYFNFTVDEKLFPDTNDTSMHSTVSNTSQFKCPLGGFYQCMAKQTSKLEKAPFISPSVVQSDVFITVSNMKAEAFRTGNKPGFLGAMSECSADYVPNKVVPIVVGVALAVMIVIALITFIVGSRRRQAGYQEI